MRIDERIQSLLDKQTITETLMVYSRAIDRKDSELLRSIYWPDAYDDHLLYQGDVEGLVEYCFSFADENVATQHLIGNVLVEIENAENAHSEAYYQAFHDLPTADGQRENLILGGRYLDHFQKRNEQWKILRRTLTVDWYQQIPSSADWANGLLANIKTRGASKPNDPLYDLNPMA